MRRLDEKDKRHKVQTVHVVDMVAFNDLAIALLDDEYEMIGFSTHETQFQDRNGWTESETNYVGVFAKRGY